MKRISRDNKGQSKTIAVIFIAVVVVLLLYMAGMLSFTWPGATAEGKYSQVVNRNVGDTGIKVPLEIKLVFDQDAGDNTANVYCYIQHKHETYGSDQNYVPDPTLVDQLDYNTEVGNVGDTKTIYSINGASFKASNVSWNSTKISLANVNYGKSQNNYKVWTKDTTYTPGTTKDSSALLIQTVWTHKRKATNEILSADTVNFLIYYDMPKYSTSSEYTKSYTYYVYVPFNDYSVLEDIDWQVRGYFERCEIQWETIEVVEHVYWDFPMLNKFFPNVANQIKLVKSRDVNLVKQITYSWKGPTDFSLDNSDTYGSHTYMYKIR